MFSWNLWRMNDELGLGEGQLRSLDQWHKSVKGITNFLTIMSTCRVDVLESS